MTSTDAPGHTQTPKSLRVRWLSWLAVIFVPITIASIWPFTLFANLAAGLGAQLITSILIAKVKARHWAGMIGWTILLMLLALILEAVAAFLWIILIGKR
jgi:hypothetical protein